MEDNERAKTVHIIALVTLEDLETLLSTCPAHKNAIELKILASHTALFDGLYHANQSEFGSS